ncbi:hypothetical protein GCM10017559_04360 [Streptosporangium longisporum]|uniref:Uncharacterized protein n=1 Tax=Streptosporangium longisporum TaxID=46187 RepID=A0ABN3XQE1_9ACTN
MDYGSKWAIPVVDMDRAVEPDVIGSSRRLWFPPNGKCLVRVTPACAVSRTSVTKSSSGTGPLRLDFYEKTAAQVTAAGVPCVFRKRISEDPYLADHRPEAAAGHPPPM